MNLFKAYKFAEKRSRLFKQVWLRSNNPDVDEDYNNEVERIEKEYKKWENLADILLCKIQLEINELLSEKRNKSLYKD